MAKAGFDGSFPAIKRRGLGSWIDYLAFRELAETLQSFPIPIKKLFGFNLREIVYFHNLFFPMPTPAAFVDDHLMRDKYTMVIFRNGIRKHGGPKLLVHELGHTLDTRSYPVMQGVVPKDHFPDWLFQAGDDKRWQAVLRAEPRPTEFSANNPHWARRPSEQWACRLAATIAADYLVPAGLLPENDIVMERKLSVRQFQACWPKSYRFFRRYIKTILAHSPQSLS